MLTRIYFDHPLSSGATLPLDERNRHHLLNVLRLPQDQEIVVFNGQGGEYGARLKITGKKAQIEIATFHNVNRESNLKLNLVQAISSSDRMDYTVQKAAELGVTEISPVYSERSQHRLNAERMEKKLQHWQGVIISACEQSGRCILPVLNKAITLAEWVATYAKSSTRRYILDPDTAEHSLSVDSNNGIAMLVGPEGGFSPAEVDNAIRNGCIPVRLGPRIFRTETAGVVAAAILQGMAGDLLK
jgi:16S rRNA (uracil1498-N3)-methyltransferase